MNEAEYARFGRVLEDGLKTRLIVVHVLLQLSALDVKYIDEHFNIAEYVISLAGEVILHECLLTVTIVTLKLDRWIEKLNGLV